MRSRHLGPWVGLLLVAGVLAGCATPSTAGTTPDASASGVPSITTTPTPAPSATATAVSADPAEWVISFDGVGPVVIGATPDAEAAAAAPVYTAEPPESCPNPATTILHSATNPTFWLKTTPDQPDVVSMIAVGGDLPDETRTAGSPRTAEGVGIGATRDAVVAAYPNGTTDDSLPARVTIGGVDSTGVDRFLVFQFSEDIVQTILVQSDPAVVFEFCG
ncbi:hypothetical protein ACFM35_03600 [Microbacterium sp. P01]|uniref:hypothetical protein n=1 Tax=Microbacterium sp. P01 TaxID=3366261 RepID=UPI003671262C